MFKILEIFQRILIIYRVSRNKFFFYKVTSLSSWLIFIFYWRLYEETKTPIEYRLLLPKEKKLNKKGKQKAETIRPNSPIMNPEVHCDICPTARSF